MCLLSHLTQGVPTNKSVGDDYCINDLEKQYSEALVRGKKMGPLPAKRDFTTF